MDYKYKFSIVTAVYNVEDYVADTIESIIGQTIGFSNIQLILVDDGSPDKSGEICDGYAEKYPNITVIHKENGGVSSARNAGLAIAEGKYINFIDSDDMLSNNALEEVEKFFEEHYDEVDVAAIPLMFFDARKGPHVLNYKFNEGTRVVDLEEDWNCIQMHAASGFFKSEVVKNLSFDTSLAYAEDAKFVQFVLLNKRKIGLLSTAEYLYRSRKSSSSAIQTAGNKPNWYIPVLKGFHKDVISYCIDNFGSVPKFIQMNVMYDIQWRVKRVDIAKEEAGLKDDEKQEYLSLIKELLTYIDDDVIMAQKQTQRQHKMFIMQLKYSSLPTRKFTKQNICYSFNSESVFKISKVRLYVDFFKIENNRLTIEGCTDLYNLPYEKVNIIVWVDGKAYHSDTYDRQKSIKCLGNDITVRYGFRMVYKLNTQQNVYDVKLGIEIDGKKIELTNVIFNYFAPFSNHLENTYYTNGGWFVALKDEKNHFIIERANKKMLKCAEAKFVEELSGRNLKDAGYYLKIRKEYFKKKRRKIRPLWLITDRFGKAGDNGEAFFKYLVKNKRGINARFIISKESPDYDRIKKIGKVVDFGTRKQDLAVLLSDCILSSQGENEYFDPFKNRKGSREFFRDILANKPFVFLQHGVIKNDLSDWLNRFNKNIFGFITSAKREKESIVNGKYFYDEKQIWLTGLPRFDYLRDESQNIITFLPTWRKYLTAGFDVRTSIWKLKTGIEESDYVKFYNSVLTDERLIECCKKHGYKIEFTLHPNLISAANLFKSCDVVTVVSSGVNYNEIYAKSKLVVTDYSSAVFDFVYLKKPIIYAQFDADSFYSGTHTSKFGYFDDAKDGFGEVEYDAEGTVNRIIEYIENDCKLKPEYRRRIDEFFAFDDKNNCKRVYEKIIENLKM